MNGTFDFVGGGLGEESKEADHGEEAICFGSGGVHRARVTSSDTSRSGDDDGVDGFYNSEVAFAAFHAAISDDDSG